MEKKWIFALPEPEFGEIVDGFYNAGPMLEDDLNGAVETDSIMQIVCGVSAADFEGYKAAFIKAGFKMNLENAIGGNLFADFAPYHLSYFAKRLEMRVTLDKTSTPIDEFGYSCKGGEQTVVYQYGLYYDRKNQCTPTTVNCGMLYVIKLSDNSLMMIDGGHIYQWPEAAMEHLWEFICRITGKKDGEKVRIAGWYFTHAHDDHSDGCTKLLLRHGDEIELERIMMNYTSSQIRAGSPTCYKMKQVVREMYPNVKQLKVHSGQKFNLADAEIEFFYAQEDAVEADSIDKWNLRDFNCTSAILKFTVDGKSIMFLGDTNIETEALMARITDREAWKADFVQVAHHCFNYLDTLYEWICAPIAMLPNSYFGGHTPENTPKLAGVIKYLSSEDNIYYEGEATDGFAVVDGEWKRIFTEPVVGSEYDGSGF